MKITVEKNAMVAVSGFAQKLSAGLLTPAFTPSRVDVSSKSAQDDLVWFADNPNRQHHVRYAVEGDEWMGRITLTVVRKDDDKLRQVPVPANFIPPDAEDFAHALYLMSLEVIAASAKAALAGHPQEMCIDQDQYVERVVMLRMLGVMV